MRRALFIGAIVLAAMINFASHANADAAMPDFTMTGHDSAVAVVAFSPDSKQLASVDSSGHLKVWDVATKKQVFGVEVASGEHQSVRFSPDSKSVYALVHGGVGAFDTATGKALPTIAVENLQGGVSAFDLSPDGKQIAVVGRGALKIYEIGTAAPKAEWEVHANYGIVAVAFSPDGKHVATASTDHTSLVVDWATGSIPATLDLKMNGAAVLFTADGKRVLTWAEDGVLRSFDAASGEGETLSERGTVKTMALSADGKSIVLGGMSRGPNVLSIAEKKLVDNVYDSASYVFAAAASPDGKWVAGGANDGPVYLWKAR